MTPYLPIFTLFVLAVLFASISFVASRLLAPRRVTDAKIAPYECGILPQREPSQRFPVRFYLLAMIFIIFDIEIIFLYPWATIYGEADFAVFGLVEMLVFAGITFIALMYLVANGGLNWGPVKKFQKFTEERTTESTIRRISRSDEAA